MESTSAISVIERQNEDLGKAEGSETTKTSSPECEPAKRVRNSKGERNFICSRCHKTYMSYAALYTHCRTKHDDVARDELNYMKKQSSKLMVINRKKRARSPIRMAGGEPGPSKTQESDQTVPALRRLLQQVGVSHQTAQVPIFY